jgi:hypothetical protein
VESQLRDAAVNAALPADFIRDPYPYFAQKRDGAGVFHGTVVDYSETPESLRPKNSFAAMSFDAVNTAFRDGKVFSSTYYDHTIGLFIGPSILAMEGKKHREHRNLASAAFKSKALARWEPEIVRPICDALTDEFIDAGHADLSAISPSSFRRASSRSSWVCRPMICRPSGGSQLAPGICHLFPRLSQAGCVSIYQPWRSVHACQISTRWRSSLP